MKLKTIVSGHLIAIIALAASLAVAGQNKNKAEPINKGSDGVAIKGFDAVAYFTTGKPIKGSPQFQHEWMGAKWHFVNAANRDQFAKSPERYAPQYGGYCAWAVSNDYVYDADPEIWKIVDGKLYLNYNRFARFRWEQDIPGRIKKADENWPKLHQ